MVEWIANFFRFGNSHVVTTKFSIARKLLKVNLLISYYFNKRFQKLGGKPSPYLISNFDSDIVLNIDRSRAMGSSLFWTGFHEFKELMYLHRFLKPHMIALDVGANLGEYTLFMAKRLSKGKVIAFEPVETTRNELVFNCGLNPFDNIQILGYGLGKKQEMITIYEIDDAHEGLSTVYPGDRKVRASFVIQLQKLDDEFESLGISSVDFIKLDIEGGELFALQGAKKVIEKFLPMIMIEINDVTYGAANYSSHDVDSFMATLGYKPYQVNKNGDLAKCSLLPSFGNIIYVAG